MQNDSKSTDRIFQLHRVPALLAPANLLYYFDCNKWYISQPINCEWMYYLFSMSVHEFLMEWMEKFKVEVVVVCQQCWLLLWELRRWGVDGVWKNKLLFYLLKTLVKHRKNDAFKVDFPKNIYFRSWIILCVKILPSYKFCIILCCYFQIKWNFEYSICLLLNICFGEIDANKNCTIRNRWTCEYVKKKDELTWGGFVDLGHMWILFKCN